MRLQMTERQTRAQVFASVSLEMATDKQGFYDLPLPTFTGHGMGAVGMCSTKRRALHTNNPNARAMKLILRTPTAAHPQASLRSLAG